MNVMLIVQVPVFMLDLFVLVLWSCRSVNLWGSVTSFQFSAFDRIVRPGYRSLSG
jgi:hypothetical protein